MPKKNNDTNTNTNEINNNGTAATNTNSTENNTNEANNTNESTKPVFQRRGRRAKVVNSTQFVLKPVIVNGQLTNQEKMAAPVVLKKSKNGSYIGVKNPDFKLGENRKPRPKKNNNLNSGTTLNQNRINVPGAGNNKGNKGSNNPLNKKTYNNNYNYYDYYNSKYYNLNSGFDANYGYGYDTNYISNNYSNVKREAYNDSKVDQTVLHDKPVNIFDATRADLEAGNYYFMLDKSRIPGYDNMTHEQQVLAEVNQRDAQEKKVRNIRLHSFDKKRDKIMQEKHSLIKNSSWNYSGYIGYNSGNYPDQTKAFPLTDPNKPVKLQTSQDFVSNLNLFDNAGMPGIIQTGDIELLKKYEKSENYGFVTDDDRKIITNIRRANDKFNKIEQQAHLDIQNNKQKKVPEVKQQGNIFYIPGIKLDRQQTSGCGCWSCAMELLLQSRGVKVTQEELRAYRPEYDEKDVTEFINNQTDTQRERLKKRNTDTFCNISENADLVQKLCPNTMLKEFTINRLPDIETLTTDNKKLSVDEYVQFAEKYREEAINVLSEKITNAIIEKKSPIAMVYGGHYTTICGIDPVNHVVYVKNSARSRSYPNDIQPVSIDSIVDSYLLKKELLKGNSESSIGGIQLTWLEDAVPSKGEVSPGLKYDEEGNPMINYSDPNVDVKTAFGNFNDGFFRTGQVNTVHEFKGENDLPFKLKGTGLKDKMLLGYENTFFPKKLHLQGKPAKDFSFANMKKELNDAYEAEKNARNMGLREPRRFKEFKKDPVVMNPQVQPVQPVQPVIPQDNKQLNPPVQPIPPLQQGQPGAGQPKANDTIIQPVVQPVIQPEGTGPKPDEINTNVNPNPPKADPPKVEIPKNPDADKVNSAMIFATVKKGAEAAVTKIIEDSANLSAVHRLGFAGKDSDEMRELKQSIDVLREYTNEFRKTSDDKLTMVNTGRYLGKLYIALGKSIEYKLAKDSDGQAAEDRTRMGYNRYMANMKVMEGLIKEIKRVEKAMKPLIEKNKAADTNIDFNLMKFDIKDPTRLIGATKMKNKITSTAATAEKHYLMAINANYRNLLSNAKFSGVKGVENLLAIDKFMSEVSAGDIGAHPAYRDFIEKFDPKKPVYEQVPTIRSEEARKKSAVPKQEISKGDFRRKEREFNTAFDKSFETPAKKPAKTK